MPEEFDPLKLFRSIFQRKDESQLPEKKSDPTTLFLEWMEKLDYSERIKRVRALGAESRSEDQASAEHAKKILKDLRRAGFYERQLALLSTSASRNTKSVFRFTKDKSKILRNMAANLSISICTDEQLHEILLAKKFKERRKMLKGLIKEERQGVVDTFLKALAELAPDEFSRLVYYGSEELMKESLESVAEQMSNEDAARFAYKHPDLYCEFLNEKAAGCTREDPAFLRLIYGGFGWLSEFRPEKALTLLGKLLTLYPASRLPCEYLLYRYPERTVGLLFAQPEFGGVDIVPILHKLPRELVLEAIREKRVASNVPYRLHKFPPELRGEIFAKCSEAWRTTDGAIYITTLEQLPRTTRISEAKKCLNLPNLASRLAERLSYARVLDWEDAKKETAASIAHPEPDNRSQAFFNLVSALKYNRSNLEELLELLHKRKNEPDPVRSNFLMALSELPPSIFTEERLKQLDLLIGDALKAQDLSHSSLASIGRLLLRIFPFQRDWAAAHICSILKDRGVYFVRNSFSQFRDDDVEFLSPSLEPVIAYWESKEREGEITSLASWLDERVEHCKPLVEALCRLAQQAKTTYSSTSALYILFNHVRDRFDSLLPELLKLDESWSLEGVVYNYLSKKRQSMLTPYLGQNRFTGRFATGKTRTVPDFTTGFHRWTSTQLRTYERELKMLTEKESETNHYEQTFAIYRLAAMPEPNIMVLDRIASLSNENVAVRDTAIRCLASTDNGSGLPVLLSFLNDDRARLAIYSLRDAVLSMEESKALEILKAVPRERITVFKEILRLAGDTASKEAFDWLIELEPSELHRDVRVALLRALWNFPQNDLTWEIMNKTVASGDAVFADLAIRFPTDRLTNKARASLLQIYKVALDSSDASTRVKTLNVIAYGTILDPELILMDALLKNLVSDSEDECRAAAWTASGLYSGRGMNVLSEFIQAVIDKPRNFVSFTNQILTRYMMQKQIFSNDARSLCAVLSKHPKAVEYQVELTGSILSYPELHSLLAELEKAGRLHLGAMNVACSILTNINRTDIEALDDLERKLQKEKSENLRRLGLAALCGLGNGPSGWTPELLRRLKDYRSDSALLVSSAAEYTFPPSEHLTVQPA